MLFIISLSQTGTGGWLLLSDENPSDRTKDTGKVFSTSPPLSKQIESVITDNPLFHYISR